MTAEASIVSIVAPVEDRLDRVVTAAMPALSRAQVRRLIEAGRVQVEGVTTEKSSTTVAAGTHIEVDQPLLPDLDIAGGELPLAILYEDEETLVLDKPAGIIVHPREGLHEITLINIVRAHYPEVRVIDASDRGGVVHRLDRDTSGVIVFAKSEASQYALKEQWRLREVSKRYLAIVEGRPDPAAGEIDAPLGPDPADPRRRAVVEHGQSARSEYRVLEQYGDEAALCLVRIYTGRTHQIRVHMSAVGHPVLGDFIYGSESTIIARQALHAWRLEFTLASNGARREFVAPLPADLRAAIVELRAQHEVTIAPEIRSARMSFVGPARVRYAPSPTGEPHIGNIRTAIWSWLYARHTGGQFLVRIEDTDQSREVPGSVGRILDSLRWLGLTWDEGPDIGGPYAPYVQSQRLDDYHAAAQRLLATDHAYRCFCTAERLDAMRKQQQAEHQATGYDGLCRTIAPAEAEARAASEPFVVRFKVPHEGTTVVEDLLRGPISVENRTLDDFVLLKSDGFPTYHLAHPVDDTAMHITHVTRGDEWLPSAPRHALIFDALGYPRPIYVHNAIILAPGGGKLSKRHGAKSVLEFAEDGYLPDAIVNFLCITGWGHGDDTVLSREELIQVFDMGDLSLAPATFDIEKLNWMNGVYLRNTPDDALVELFATRLEHDLPAEVARPIDRGLVAAFAPLIRERIQLLADVLPLVDFFYATDVPTPPVEEFLVKRWRGRAAEAAAALDAAVEAIDGAEWTASALEATLRATAEVAGVPVGDLFSLIRLAVTGKAVTPPLFESMAIVGPEACLDRLRAAAAALRAAA